MRHKKLIKLFSLTTVLFIFFIGCVNFVIDPFQQYRRSTFHKTIFMKEFHLNSGLIKNYNFDAVVIGSSMTQNFIINEVNQYLKTNNAIKLPVSGGNIVEHHTVLASAIKSGKVKNVLLGLDIFSLKDSENRLPTYLYDYKIMNDYLYLISIDTMKRSLLYPVLHHAIPKNHARLNKNLMFQWQHLFTEEDFNSKRVLSSMASNSVNLDANVSQEILAEERRTNFEKYLLPLIKDNPNINYIIFYPPYSILVYKLMDQLGSLKHFILMKEQIFNQLSKYKNVRIYDFQTAKKITFNLNNYKDITHYHQKINTWMLQQISQNNFLMKEENIKSDMRDFSNQIESYNFNKLPAP